MLAGKNEPIGKRDRDFFEHLFSAYRTVMFCEINKIVFNTWEAEDILQSSFVKLSEKIELLRQLDEPRRMFYVVVTAKNNAKNHVRSAQRTRAYSLDDELYSFAGTLCSETNMEQLIISKEQQRQLRTAWARLDEASKILLEGRYILKMTDTELAKRLGTKPASIRMMLTRARRRTLQLLREQDGAAFSGGSAPCGTKMPDMR